jgi:hypothetical protein
MIIINNAIPDHLRQAAAAVFPASSWEWWHRYGNGKLATVDPSRIPTACTVALHSLAANVRPVSGFYDFDLYGAGLHLMPAGTALGRHLGRDTSSRQTLAACGVPRVYFLEDCDGGELVIGSERVRPLAGTAVMFAANQWHEVLTTNQDRRTLSLFAWQIDHGTKENTSAYFERQADQ